MSATYIKYKKILSLSLSVSTSEVFPNDIQLSLATYFSVTRQPTSVDGCVSHAMHFSLATRQATSVSGCFHIK